MNDRSDEITVAAEGGIKHRARRVRAPKTDGYQLKEGDRFTIDGWGTSARGHAVMYGRSAKTGRKMKVKTLQVFVVQKPKA